MQRVMNKVIGELSGREIEVYMDDIIIHLKEIKEHHSLLKEVMRKLEANKIRVNPKKLQLGLNDVNV